MISRKFLLVSALAAAPILSGAQAPANSGGVDPASLKQPLAESWTTYSGDYTGQRYSKLSQINRETVKNLTLSWTVEMSSNVPGFGTAGGRGGGGGGANQVRHIVSGKGTGDPFVAASNIKGAILESDGVLYVTCPDHTWAVDARDGTEIWHYFWKTRGGTHIGSRGSALWHNTLYFETPDNYLVAVDARTGEERWAVEIASFDEQYFSTMAPIVIGNKVIAGTGNDLDMPGFAQAFDAETGKLIWKTYMVPMNPGDPGLETWPSLDAARHGGGQHWIPGVYDPETNLYIFGTGNPTPGYTGVGRKGDNLFTCCIVALDADTGKMKWYFQPSPHDTHDWDAAQVPILFDGQINGRPRKLLSTASRNGYFFTIDRTNGQHIVTSKFGTATNWAQGVRKTGEPEANPGKEAIIPGSLVSPVEGGVTNWQPSAFNPQTGLFYTQENNGFNLLYLTDPDPRGSMGLGGKERVVVGQTRNAFQAIDYKTGKAVWRHEWPRGGGGSLGVLTSAGNVVFTGDGNGNLVAFDAANGNLLWHTRIGNPSNSPQTYLLDGKQHLLVAVGTRLFDFVLY